MVGALAEEPRRQAGGVGGVDPIPAGQQALGAIERLPGGRPIAPIGRQIGGQERHLDAGRRTGALGAPLRKSQRPYRRGNAEALLAMKEQGLKIRLD